ncbi:hypothetical protein P280DRAFT_62511 [Massarina eburnea CBS 473.64]|uniref:Uncharacterized protein n=1 Tax=Massarina eburnea CBS 473.64 TaxID=1395130 RepID=A0A6A6RVP4_9PLEO|nr:hypothetical protein P280DRAFT_62511 [Massarina eburnea CBS 473.64]
MIWRTEAQLVYRWTSRLWLRHHLGRVAKGAYCWPSLSRPVVPPRRPYQPTRKSPSHLFLEIGLCAGLSMGLKLCLNAGPYTETEMTLALTEAKAPPRTPTRGEHRELIARSPSLLGRLPALGRAKKGRCGRPSQAGADRHACRLIGAQYGLMQEPVRWMLWEI